MAWARPKSSELAEETSFRVSNFLTVNIFVTPFLFSDAFGLILGRGNTANLSRANFGCTVARNAATDLQSLSTERDMKLCVRSLELQSKKN